MPHLSLNKTPHETYAPLDPLGFSGRIGRMRLLAWSLVLTLITWVAVLPVALALKVSYTLGFTCALALILAYLMTLVRISAQRLHDLNWSAWLLLLHLVPVATFILSTIMILTPGTPGHNQYGPPPPPNSTAVKVLAWISIILSVVLFVVGILLFALGIATSFIDAATSNSL
ncbi:DUF805 domain-containing protein [Pseudomonas weihenstephanensis]|uniref:DUF805 domain-containing protein n=1 Tax=Pseudomonas weihenstephanensis TaxID=1608994 RepID=UPI000653E9CE|nr:DUF805 domain-containing protein [Pseudomonas weihenstephanensis]KMN17166.1 hypothetical protein TU87_16715 [Pseudomonas weihenstephanensis]MBM1190714.1 DUF805 domain-containing protein [Pseudomonas weihenstephanensis]GLX89240.1 hypothetical protein Pfra02_18090 [Pseudomonas fragi]